MAVLYISSYAVSAKLVSSLRKYGFNEFLNLSPNIVKSQLSPLVG
jgi:hypothetical protein